MSFIYARFSTRNPKRYASNDNTYLLDGIPIPGFDPVFRVTSCGQVFKNGRRLKGDVHYKGYRRVSIRRDGKNKNYYIHALVALAFLGPRPDGFHVDHIDYDKLNNSVANLRYLSAQENSMRRRGFGK